MIIRQNIERSTGGFSLALGFFDGLHRGHMSVLKSTAAQKASGLTPAVLTFKESPQGTLSKRTIPRLITTKSRNELLEKIGIEVLYEINFNSIRDMTPHGFVTHLLCDKLGAKKVFCGFNYHFGKFGAGDEKTLHALCAECKIESETLPPVIFAGEPVSSTRIRTCLENGDVLSANEMLGRRFSFEFTVGHGNELGRKMKTPTINQIIPPNFILPKFGVYATIATVGGKSMRAVTNIGVKPTVGSDRPLAETWILDGDMGDLYGSAPKIELVEFIRPEKKFSSISELQSAILSDGETAKNIFQTFGILL